MFTLAIFVPLIGALGLVLWPGLSERAARAVAIATTLVPLVVSLVAWARFDNGGALFQLIEEVEWIPSLGMAYRVGVDGIALALVVLTALLFTAAVAYPSDTLGRARQYYAWFLFLEFASLGLFLSLDLILFYVFFDLSLVGMYFLIGRWGHGGAKAAALKFFLYTLAGSLLMLLAILGLALVTDPLTFDMIALIEQQPLAGTGVRATIVMLGFLIGFGIKTPVVPFHTWLPVAHVESPAPASTILAGVLLKMGTFGVIRIPLSMMRETFATFAFAIGVVGVISIVYGALVAFGQGHLKRRIAYTSVNHMGYTVLGIAAAGGLVTGSEGARQLALTGATVEMVAHGLITGALFLITGTFWERGKEYDLDAFGGLARTAPALTSATILASFASLGLPGLAGFVAEFQIIAGTFSIYPVLAGIALLGILVTAALFLQMMQKLFFGDLPPRWADFGDLGTSERATLGTLLALVVVIGVYPRFLLDLIGASNALLTGG